MRKGVKIKKGLLFPLWDRILPVLMGTFFITL